MPMTVEKLNAALSELQDPASPTPTLNQLIADSGLTDADEQLAFTVALLKSLQGFFSDLLTTQLSQAYLSSLYIGQSELKWLCTLYKLATFVTNIAASFSTADTQDDDLKINELRYDATTFLDTHLPNLYGRYLFIRLADMIGDPTWHQLPELHELYDTVPELANACSNQRGQVFGRCITDFKHMLHRRFGSDSRHPQPTVTDVEGDPTLAAEFQRLLIAMRKLNLIGEPRDNSDYYVLNISPETDDWTKPTTVFDTGSVTNFLSYRFAACRKKFGDKFVELPSDDDNNIKHSQICSPQSARYDKNFTPASLAAVATHSAADGSTSSSTDNAALTKIATTHSAVSSITDAPAAVPAANPSVLPAAESAAVPAAEPVADAAVGPAANPAAVPAPAPAAPKPSHRRRKRRRQKRVIEYSERHGVARSNGDRQYQQDAFASADLAPTEQDKLKRLSDYDRRCLLWNTTLRLQEEYGNAERSNLVFKFSNNFQLKDFNGSTAIITLTVGHKTYYSSVGDSEAYFVRIDTSGNAHIERLNSLHNLPNSRPPLLEILNLTKTPRIMHSRLHLPDGSSLAMSNAIGDTPFEEAGLHHTPNEGMLAHELAPGEQGFIFNVTDGVADGFRIAEYRENHNPNEKQYLQRIAKVIEKAVADGKQPPQLSKCLVETALELQPPGRGSNADNTTAISAAVDENTCRLAAAFDGHGCTSVDDRGELLVNLSVDNPKLNKNLISYQCSQNVERIFTQELNKAYQWRQDISNQRKPIPTKLADGCVEMARDPEEVQRHALQRQQKTSTVSKSLFIDVPSRMLADCELVVENSLNCLSTPGKVNLFAQSWNGIQIAANKDNLAVSDIQEVSRRSGRALIATMNGSKITLLNSGATLVTRVNKASIKAALQLQLTAKLMNESPDLDGVMIAEQLTPTCDPATGELHYPNGHRLAGEVISINVHQCDDPKRLALIRSTAKELGLSIVVPKPPRTSHSITPASAIHGP